MHDHHKSTHPSLPVAPARNSVSKIIAAVVCLPLLGAGQLVHAQEAATANAMGKSIDADAKETAAKLEVITQTAYAQEQRVIALNFQLEYGDRVRLKRISYASADRNLIPGYVFTPLKMEKGKRYPALVIVHGGFHDRLDWHWFPLINSAVEKGYVVMFPEYRGSRGYGEAIYRNNYGITDTADVISAGEYIGKQEFVDSAKLGIVGHSRGGMVTLLAIEKAPVLFQAAVDIVGLTDFVAYMAYKSERRRQEIARESAYFKGKLPNENLAPYMEVSPINYVDKIEIPLLVLATRNDKTAPIAMHTGRLLDALKARGKTHEYHIYEDAPGDHNFMEGDTAERRDATGRVFDFLSRYIKP